MITKLSSQFAIPVLRHQDEKTLKSLALSLAEGGMNVLEITIMSESAYSVIKELSKDKNLTIGAGTILNKEQAKKAIDAGANFLVSPGLNTEAVNFSLSQNIPFIPGVLTPSEVMEAMALGLDTVKVFPISNVGGASYLSALSGPFPQMKWMVTGGISQNDIPVYMNVGAFCVGLGGKLTPKDAIESGDWKKLTSLAISHLDEVKKARIKN